MSKKIIKPKKIKVFEFKKLEKVNPRENKRSFPIPEIKMNREQGLISAKRLCAHFKMEGNEIIIYRFSNNLRVFSESSSITEMTAVINKLKYFAKKNNVKQISIPVFSKEHSKIFTYFGFMEPPLTKIQAYNTKLKSLGIKGIEEIIDNNHFFVMDNKNKISVLENKELHKYIPFCVSKVN